jgi:AcrR family transcriptional regulator
VKEIANYGDRRMTIREIAAALGCSHDAITKHIKELYPNLMRNGVTTYLDEAQVTEIKQKMRPTTKVVGAMTDIEAGMMTVKVIEHYQIRYEQERHKALEQEERAIRAERELMATEKLLANRTTGLSTYQRIAEAGGFALSDRDDVLGTYGRRV